MGKLVRDKIIKIMQAEGLSPAHRELTSSEYLKELRLKLLEEANEVLNAKSHVELQEELGDVMEVIACLIKAEGLSLKEIKGLQIKKRIKKGSFKKRLYLKI